MNNLVKGSGTSLFMRGELKEGFHIIELQRLFTRNACSDFRKRADVDFYARHGVFNLIEAAVASVASITVSKADLRM